MSNKVAIGFQVSNRDRLRYQAAVQALQGELQSFVGMSNFARMGMDILVAIDPPLYSRLSTLAYDSGVSVGKLIADIVRDAVDSDEEETFEEW